MGEPQTHFTDADVVVVRVLHEDADFMTLEIAKDENRELRLEEGDRFYTVIFTNGKPWENA
jgi:hypothetical protein